MHRHVSAPLVVVGVLSLACSDNGAGPTEEQDRTPASVTISGAAEVDLQGTLHLGAEVANALGQTVNATVSWTSSDDAIATVDNSGQVTGVARGTVSIHAQVQGAAGPVSDTHDVLVRIASIRLAPTTGTLTSLGDTLQLTGEAQDATGATVPGVPIAFATSDAGIATVADDGTVVAVAEGAVTVTASADGRSVDATVTVQQVAVALSLAETVDTLFSFGEQRTYEVTATDMRGNAIAQGFTWTVSNPSVATISGSAASAAATATGNGSTNVQVERDGFSGHATLVVRQVVASVMVSPSAVSMLTGGTARLSGTPQDARGNAVAGSGVTWSSEDEGVATVDAEGVVTGVATGSATISASSEGQVGTATVTVAAPSFAQHVQPIFTANCALSGCHTGSTPAMGQNLSAGQAHGSIVNVASTELPSMDRVEPGDPDASYLVHKIQGTHVDVGGSGSRMPLGRSPLTDEQIAAIRAWIKAGASNN